MRSEVMERAAGRPSPNVRAASSLAAQGMAGVYETVALKDNCVISAADGSVHGVVRTRMPMRSPAATTKGVPRLILVALRNVPAVMIEFGNPNRTELVSGVVT